MKPMLPILNMLANGRAIDPGIPMEMVGCSDSHSIVWVERNYGGRQ